MTTSNGYAALFSEINGLTDERDRLVAHCDELQQANANMAIELARLQQAQAAATSHKAMLKLVFAEVGGTGVQPYDADSFLPDFMVQQLRRALESA